MKEEQTVNEKVIERYDRYKKMKVGAHLVNLDRREKSLKHGCDQLQVRFGRLSGRRLEIVHDEQRRRPVFTSWRLAQVSQRSINQIPTVSTCQRTRFTIRGNSRVEPTSLNCIAQP